MTIIYTPTPGSTAHRVCSFFADNPDETLTKDDLCAKFDMARPSIPGLLDRAFRARYIRLSAPDQYTAGANINQFTGQVEAPASAPAPAPQLQEQNASAADPANESAPAAVVKATNRSGGRRNSLPPLDVSQVAVHTDIPLPSTATKPGQGRYVELFERLTQVGMSVQLPIVYRGAVGKATVTYCQRTRPGRKLAVRTIDANTIGIWRTA